MPYAVRKGKLEYRPTKARTVIGARNERDRSVIPVRYQRYEYAAGGLLYKGTTELVYHVTKGHRTRNRNTSVTTAKDVP